ncbi:hypothetical protein SCLCIDRAFT_1223799 [Scleroderma citrinum Foug A]|uniref:Uncharacterized protein n=1 Tax=Scleroderma citrinum Foug A TaxID=1036808 RepID=A0A0C3D7Q8_9AGAM|nr:hypothetical protein SCLCIDRAFT_1223799 [Scleroderma citrinum Foug A]
MYPPNSYILLLVSDPAERCKSSIIRTRNMIGTRLQSRKLLRMRIHASDGPIVWNLQSNKCRELSDLRVAPLVAGLSCVRSPSGFVAGAK